jgi:Host cell surface-exposed lipoprotein
MRYRSQTPRTRSSTSARLYEQAAKQAWEYLDTQAFSRSGLMPELLFEGFTQAQASYGVGQALLAPPTRVVC